MTHYVDDQGKGTVPFTPAVQVYYAFEEALNELLEEGVANRMQRYQQSRDQDSRTSGAVGHQGVAAAGISIEHDHGLSSAGRPHLCLLHDQPEGAVAMSFTPVRDSWNRRSSASPIWAP